MTDIDRTRTAPAASGFLGARTAASVSMTCVLLPSTLTAGPRG